MDALLTINQLSYQKQHRYLFQNLSLTVNPGEIVAIYGGVNSGKTALADIMAGFLRPEGGQIAGTFQKAVVTQQFNFYPDLTPRENLEFCAAINNFPASKLVDIVAATGLSGWETKRSDRIPAVLKPMLQLACALIREFDLLILDDVTTGLDTKLKQVFWRLMAQLRDEGKGIVLLTGQWDDANRCRLIIDLPSGERRPASLQQTVPGFATTETVEFENPIVHAKTNVVLKRPDEKTGSGEVIQ